MPTDHHWSASVDSDFSSKSELMLHSDFFQGSIRINSDTSQILIKINVFDPPSSCHIRILTKIFLDLNFDYHNVMFHDSGKSLKILPCLKIRIRIFFYFQFGKIGIFSEKSESTEAGPSVIEHQRSSIDATLLTLHHRSPEQTYDMYHLQ